MNEVASNTIMKGIAPHEEICPAGENQERNNIFL